jgi:MFS transporter, DHA1 family, inner membrane transport protein
VNVPEPPDTGAPSDTIVDVVAGANVDTRTLARLTGAKTVTNIALRWIPPFLPTLERAFGATTTQLTTVLGVGEAAGLSTVFVGRQLDRGRERAVMVGSLGLVAASALIALWGSLAAFAVSFFVLVLGVSNLTVAGQAWISHRVDYRWRARSIGLYETSWAFALLGGAPIVAVLINQFGWRGPFVAIAAASVVAAGVVAVTLPAHVAPRLDPVTPTDRPAAARARSTPITSRAWLVMVASATVAMAGLSVFVISGSWLDDAFGVSTGGVGAVAMAFGATELVSSLSSAAFADRLGKLRTTLAGIMGLLVGLGVMVVSSGRLWVGIVGLLVFLFGFELAFVTSLSLVSEAMPDARGTTLALSNAVGTVARATGAVASGWLYSAHGVGGTASLAALAALTSVACLLLSRRHRAVA